MVDQSKIAFIVQNYCYLLFVAKDPGKDCVLNFTHSVIIHWLCTYGEEEESKFVFISFILDS